MRLTPSQVQSADVRFGGLCACERPGIIIVRSELAFDGGLPLDEAAIAIASQSPAGRYE